MNYGDRVKVKNTLLCNDRTGILRPTHPDDEMWAYYVTLDDGRVIGVDTFQVEPA